MLAYRAMDLSNHLKGRIAEALVESVFRCAHYRVARIGRESQVGGLAKIGTSEFTPDFVVWKHANETSDLHHLVEVEVKYRHNINEFLRYNGSEYFADAKRAWPNLYFAFVTDCPDVGRSCFQAISLREYETGSEPRTCDLHDLNALAIRPSLIRKHENTVKQLFGALTERLPPQRKGHIARRTIHSAAVR